MPRLGIGLRPFPSDDRGPVHTEGFGQAFLTQPDRFATLCQPIPTLARHVPLPRLLAMTKPFMQLTPGNAMGMHQFCAVAALGVVACCRLGRRMMLRLSTKWWRVVVTAIRFRTRMTPRSRTAAWAAGAGDRAVRSQPPPGSGGPALCGAGPPLHKACRGGGAVVTVYVSRHAVGQPWRPGTPASVSAVVADSPVLTHVWRRFFEQRSRQGLCR